MSNKKSQNRTKQDFSQALKEEVVIHILNGNYLIEEVMERYGIKSRITIKNWLVDYIEKSKAT